MPAPNSGDTLSGRADGHGGDSGRAAGGSPASAGEFAVIERLAARLAAGTATAGLRPHPGELWIGDDAAVVDPPEGPLLLTTDLVVAGVHGDLELLTVADLGWRAVVASLSDIAAMGGRPCHAVVAVAAPPDVDLDGLYDGVTDAATAYRCPVVGGDLSGAEQLVVALSMTGTLPPSARPVLRSGARPGDAIFVTGPLGASAAGLRILRGRRPHRRDSGGADGLPGEAADALVDAHRRPRPRLRQGEAARLGGARAMVDISDGLSGDLSRLADASEVGFRLEHVPVAEGARLDEALSGGEDYELLMAVPDPAALQRAFDVAGLPAPIELGVCVGDRRERTLGGAALPAGGWEHRLGYARRRGPRGGR